MIFVGFVKLMIISFRFLFELLLVIYLFKELLVLLNIVSYNIDYIVDKF